MAEALTRASLRRYRQLRADTTPEDALVRIRDEIRVAREFAIDAERWTHAAELRDQEGYLTMQLQNVRLRADQRGRSGAFWRDGLYRGALMFGVLPWGQAGPMPPAVHCTSSGCAIKHALAMLRRGDVTSVTIDANRPDWRIRVSGVTTLQILAEHVWPEN